MIYYVIPARKNSKGFRYKNRFLFEKLPTNLKKENVINPLHAIYEKSSWINILLNNLENGNFSTKSINHWDC